LPHLSLDDLEKLFLTLPRSGPPGSGSLVSGATVRERPDEQMTTRMTWPELCRSEQFKGLWVALDNCRYDQETRQPMEGDVVDSDEELSELCFRMREAGSGSCAIFFCDDDVFVASRALEPTELTRPLRP
jgi:hypothetical protein